MHFVKIIVVLVGVILISTFQIVEAQSETCANYPTSELSVAEYAKVIDPDVTILYTGMPYTDYSDNQLHELSDSEWKPRADETVLLIEGPVCYEGMSLWRIQAPKDVPSSSNQSTDNIWISENIGKKQNLVLAEPPNIPRTIIELPQAAPIVDGNLQLAYSSGGAGGPSKPPCLEAFDRWQTTVYLGLDYLSNGICMEIGFEVSAGDTAHFLHHGRVYFQQTLETKQRFLNLPQDETQPIGIWIVEIETANQIRQIAYEVDILSPFKDMPEINRVCDDYYPSLYFMGFQSNEQARIALVSGVEELNNYELVAVGEPEQIWDISVGEDGTLLASLGFIQNELESFINVETRDIGMINNHQFYETADGSFQLTIQGYGLDPMEIGFNEMPFACLLPTNDADIANLPVEAGRLAAGTIGGDAPDPVRFAYSGQENSRLTITVAALNEAFDPIVRLYHPDGELLVENDDAVEAEFGLYDSQISDFEIQESGLYIIEISRVSVESGTFLLLVEEE